MINIERLQLIIVKQLKPHNSDKSIRFGSYAYGTPMLDDLYIGSQHLGEIVV